MKSKLFSIFCLLSFTTIACWFNRINYIDYIYGANDVEDIATYELINDGSTKYQRYIVTNNKVVDLPITAIVKLTSGSTPNFTSEVKPQIVRCVLQYRVLPKGNWVTVKEYETPSGTIPFDAPPFAYFGKNNIWPKDLKAGDAIMIRVYITDGIYQSGNILDKCEDKLTNVSTSFGTKKTLPNFTYTIGQTPAMQYDLGGNWYPNQCITVIWSGKTRPIR